MADSYSPAQDINRFLCGTQPISAMAMAETGLDIMLDVDAAALRAKSLAMTVLFITLVEQRCRGHPLELITPGDHTQRGSHVSFRHPEGYAVMSALIARGVIGDYRAPEVLRFGITPLYLGFAGIWDAVGILREILDTRSWDVPESK
ncbi:kynureninase/PvdN C-terminal domain-containing protein [Arthrobacter sp. Sr24]